MKKFTVGLAVLLIGLLPVLCAYADSIIPYAVLDKSITAGVSVSGTSGTGNAVARFPPGCSAKTTIYVQESTNGTWSTIASASGTNRVLLTFSARSSASYRVYAETIIIDAGTGESERLTTYSVVATN